MSAAAIATLVLIGAIVVALATTLLEVLRLLRRLVDTLGKVTFGVRAIAARVEPLDPLLAEVNADLEAVAGAAETLADDVAAPRRAAVGI